MKKSNLATKLLVILVVVITLWGIIFMNKANKKSTTTENKVWGVETMDYPYARRKDGDLYMDSPYINSLFNSDLRSYFYLNDGTTLKTISALGSGVWKRGTSYIGGQATLQPLPERVKITYMSIFEQQFYQLDVGLPVDKLQALFNSAYLTTDEYEKVDTYDYLLIGIAVGGWVVIYAQSFQGNRTLLGMWQAKKIEADYTLDLIYTWAPGGIDEIEELRASAEKREQYKQEKGNMQLKHYQDYTLPAVKRDAPKLYEMMVQGLGIPNADWFTQSYTKYPWNVEVTGDGARWVKEYVIEYANLERQEILRDRLDSYKKELKAVPTIISTWVIEESTQRKYYIEIHLLPMPNWVTMWRYTPYDRDPNLTRLMKQFQELYPHRTFKMNDTSAQPEDFATLKIHLNEDGHLQDIYLQKGDKKISIDGAYQYYLAEVDPDKNGYTPYYDGFDYFLTKPKVPDLSDPNFIDIDE